MTDKNKPLSKQKVTPRKSVGGLIVAFLLLSITLGIAMSYVTRYAQSVTQFTEAENKIIMQRRATDNLLTQLLNASTQAEALSMQYADDTELRRYMQAVVRIDTAIVRLKILVDDSKQKTRIDSLQYLVHQRRDGIVNLVNALRHENNKGNDLQRQIKDLHNNERPINLKVGVPIVERGEQVIIERRKRGFFRRLGDAFKRAKDDTVLTQLTQNESIKDTTQTQVNIADTLARVLTGVHKNLQRDSLAHAKTLYRKSDQLRATSAELSQRMTMLIDNITTAQQKHIAQVSHNEQQQRSAAARKLGHVAFWAVVLSALLLFWLWHDIKRSNRYRRTLERVMLQREHLLLTISHDIKAPVNSILGYLNLLPQKQVQQSKELSAISTSAQYLLHLVKALVEYYKLENEDVEIHSKPTNLYKLLHEIITIFKPLAEQKGLEFTCNIEQTKYVLVDDAFQLRQIIENLLSNAIKYTTKGEVHLCSVVHPAGLLCILVHDTGCGMSEADIDRIFQPFTRVKGSEGQEGAGLGLCITQKLIKRLGGELKVKSELGKGSTFRVNMKSHFKEIPYTDRENDATSPTDTEAQNNADNLTQSHAKALTLAHAACSTNIEAQSNAENHASENLQGTIHIAVLDDDALQMQLTEAMLRNVLPAEAQITTFNQAEQLLAWLKQDHKPTLVMTDIEMPSMSGYEVLSILRQEKLLSKEVQVIAMTSHTLIPATDFKEHGFADVLFKPFTQNDLLRVFKATPAMLRKEQAHFKDGTSTEQTYLLPKKQEVALPHLALNNLLVFAQDDSQAQKDILQQFATDCQQHFTKLQAACQAHHKTEACRIAHKMLPTFTLIQSTAIAALQELERRRFDNIWQPDDEALCQTVLNELKIAIEELKKTEA